MADEKITDYDELTDVASTDLLEVVDDPGGTPASKKATVANVCLGGMVDIGAKVSHSTTESIATATWTALSADSEEYDTDTIHDTVTNNSRLTCKTAGKYWVYAVVQFAANATGDRGAAFDVNGAGTYHGVQRVGAFATGNCDLTPGEELELDVDDYVECRCRHSKGSNLDVQLLAFGMRRVA